MAEDGTKMRERREAVTERKKEQVTGDKIGKRSGEGEKDQSVYH